MSNFKSKSTGYDTVRKTQKALYLESGISANDFEGLINLFSPEVLAKYLGLNYSEIEEIPSSKKEIETAGLLNFKSKTIYVSNQFPLNQRRLTGMHELAHWMLHKNAGLKTMHRDRTISHLPKEGSINYIEWEATNVACQYLMPEKLVRNKFSELFRLPIGVALEFDETVAFHLGKDIDELRKMDNFKRALIVSKAQSFGYHIIPLHQQFKISPTAMAIRLLELNLLAPDRHRGRPSLRIIR